MKGSLGNPIADEFLRNVERESRVLPPGRRAELIDDLRAHLREAVAEADGDEAHLRTLVDALGSPHEIVAAAEPAGRPRLAGRDLAAILLLLLGGFLAFVGWFAGVVLLWASPAWNTRQKLLGTLVVPGGLFAPFGLWLYLQTLSCNTADEQCAGWSSYSTSVVILLLVVAALGPVVTAIYLARTGARTNP
jgi:hypothetical protein